METESSRSSVRRIPMGAQRFDRAGFAGELSLDEEYDVEESSPRRAKFRDTMKRIAAAEHGAVAASRDLVL